MFSDLRKLQIGLGDRVKLSREGAMACGVYVLMLLFLFLLLADGYLFYKTVLVPEEEPQPVPKLIEFSEKDIDEILGLLESRQETFESIFRSP